MVASMIAHVHGQCIVHVPQMTIYIPPSLQHTQSEYNLSQRQTLYKLAKQEMKRQELRQAAKEVHALYV